MVRYPINEIFQSIQGEGYFSGSPALFIRLQGCPVGCSWCDTQHTWKLDTAAQRPVADILTKLEASVHWCYMDVEAITVLLDKPHYAARHVVLTGGEPCLHDLRPLTNALEHAGYRCQIETSGTYTVYCSSNTWVTMSPKIGMRGGLSITQQALVRADEIKHPVARERDITTLKTLLLRLADDKVRIVSLQPISQKSAATQLCIEACMANNWRLSVQLHKYLEIA